MWTLYWNVNTIDMWTRLIRMWKRLICEHYIDIWTLHWNVNTIDLWTQSICTSDWHVNAIDQDVHTRLIIMIDSHVNSIDHDWHVCVRFNHISWLMLTRLIMICARLIMKHHWTWISWTYVWWENEGVLCDLSSHEFEKFRLWFFRFYDLL